jgi:hypothetical protein
MNGTRIAYGAPVGCREFQEPGGCRILRRKIVGVFTGFPSDLWNRQRIVRFSLPGEFP